MVILSACSFDFKSVLPGGEDETKETPRLGDKNPPVDNNGQKEEPQNQGEDPQEEEPQDSPINPDQGKGEDNEGVAFGDFLLTDHFYDANNQGEYVGGTIVNNSQISYDAMEVEVAFTDEAGNVLDYAYGNIEFLQPGESWDFTVYVPAIDAAYYEITAIYGEPSEKGGSDVAFDPNLSIISHEAYLDGSGGTYVIGTIENTSDLHYSYVYVLVDLYDANGQYLGTSWAELDNLPPGETWDFETFLDVEADNYEIVEVMGS